MTSLEKLEKLRALMGKQGIDALLVPHTDAHRHEFLPPQSRDIAWLTGFEGSAGLVVVFEKTAVLFVDGRYTLQAKGQVDPHLFQILPLTMAALKECLKSAPHKGVLGFDPWRVSVREAQRYEALCGQAGWLFKPHKGAKAPMARVWQKRPHQPMAMLETHDVRFAGLSVQEKLSKVALYLMEENLDACLLTLGESLCWCLNLRGQDVDFTPLVEGYTFVWRDGSVDLFVDGRKVSDVLKSSLHKQNVRLHPYGDFADFAKSHMVHKKVLLDPASASVACLTLLKRVGAQVKEGQDPCLLPKACKNSQEIAGAKSAHVKDGVAIVRTLFWLDQAMGAGSQVRESDVSKRLLMERARQSDFKGPSFETISGSGPNGAIVHYRVTPQTDRVLQKGDLLLIDSGGQYLDGTTDVTRTLAWGRCDDGHIKANVTRVLKGHIALATVRFPKGTTGHQLDALARAPLWQVGLDYAHGTGHGVGSYLGVHEGPQSISTAWKDVALEEGMIVSNEPGYYKEGHYGVRLEGMQFVRASTSYDGFFTFEMLTLVPFDTALLDVSLLTFGEREWLNAYHALVFDQLAPHLDSQEKVLLEAKTRPL
ncbi:MAG: X-Pro aminopeptidase [Candidatus Puniceispirillum sp.]|nr:X-Pro aminopeptidase [Candidatus Puniceispirillum sp.]